MSGDRIRLEVQQRTELGSRRARRLRRRGLIPGVLYGKGAARAIAVAEHDLREALSGASGVHAILDVVVDGQKTVHPSVLADYQRDPVRGTLIHIDLREVRLDRPIHATVAVQLVGEAPGVKAGGILSLVTRELNVEALPGDVPEHIDVDVSGLEVGDVLRLENLPPIDRVTFLDDPHETVIVSVAAPRGFVEVEAEAEEAVEAEAAAEAAGEAPEAAGEPAEPSPEE